MSIKKILISSILILFLTGAISFIIDIGNVSFSTQTADASEEVDKEPTTTQHVLVIGSYQLDWSPEQSMLSGIQEKLSGDVLLYYYFMDTKHEDEQFSRSQLTQYLLEQEAENKKYDLVMCMDEPAFQFVNDFHARFFNKMPVVFLAINNETKVQAAARAYPTTGVAQVFPLQQTIELAKTLRPKATRVVVINDSTSAGKSSMQRYNAIHTLFPDLELRYLNTTSFTRDQLSVFLESYDDETILLYANMNNDKSGHVYTMEEAIRFLANHTNIPIFCCHEYGVGMGLIGGCVISNKEMGTRAAKIARQILNGTSPDEISIETASYRYFFDAKVMRKYNISKRSLPVGSEYINDQYAFFRTYWPHLLAISIAFVISVLLIITYMTRRSRDQARSALNTAYEASTARSNFFSRMSHEMRTPLNAVIGYAELGHEDTVDPTAAEYFRKIYSSGKYLLSVINDVLDIGKIENDKFSLHMTTIPVSRLLRHVNEMIQPLCTTHSIEYETKFLLPPHRQIVCDEIRAQQVLINLLGNAVKYTENGGRISFTFEELSTWTTHEASLTSGGETEVCNYGTYRIVVSDNGCGMSEDYLPHIFDAFVSGDDKHVAGRQGTGLGLAITKKIIDMAHGTISVESSVGKGSTFTILLDFPLAADETAEEARHEKRAEEAIFEQNANTSASVRADTGTAVTLVAETENGSGPAPAGPENADMAVVPHEATTESSDTAGAYDAAAHSGSGTAGTSRGAAPDAGIPAPAQSSKAPAGPEFAGKHLLLVEDNDLNADIETILFERLGFIVTRASNGEEGYHIFCDHPEHTFDVIIMDLLMPVLDGFGSTELIRALDRSDARTVPIIAMSASVQQEDLDHALRVGMTGTLSKPIDRGALVTVLRSQLL